MSAAARQSCALPPRAGRARRAGLGCAALLALLAAPAGAASTSLQLLGTASTGVTNDPNPGNEGDLTDSVTELSPSLLLEIRGGRLLHQLQYTFTGTLYAENFEASSYANAATWGLLAEASENVRLGFGAGFTQGQLNGFSLRAFELREGPQASGDTTFIEARLNQGLDWDVSESWSVSQTAGAGLYRPLVSDYPVPDTIDAESSLGAMRSWDKLRLGARLIGGYAAQREYVDTTVPTPPGTPGATPPGRCVLRPGGGCTFPLLHLQRAELRAEGSYELARGVTLEAAAGVLQTSVSEDFSTLYVQPTGLLRLSLEGLRATASLSLEHTFDISLQLGQTLRVERARVTGELPLGAYFHERWFLSAAVGYDYARQVIVERHELGDDMHVYIAEAGVEFRPSSSFSGSLRYELTGQTEVADPMGGAPLPSFSRHALMLRVEFRYPGSRRDRLRITRRAVQPHRVSPEQWRRFFTPTELETGDDRDGGGRRRPADDAAPGPVR